MLGVSAADCSSPVDDTKRRFEGKVQATLMTAKGNHSETALMMVVSVNILYTLASTGGHTCVDDGGISKRVSLRIIISDDSLYTISTRKYIR